MGRQVARGEWWCRRRENAMLGVGGSYAKRAGVSLCRCIQINLFAFNDCNKLITIILLVVSCVKVVTAIK